ncbi:hypothetical protein ABAC460_03330 [Asticcacaulis sp. AC460]|uniref:hypothetical protein n=1 Tax=Asticcacaulis sp. AC460 TaxID=1282360 RepID=UPI0003C3C615|nr:hypothetical protein [Asticcacaulis sp. AC460]ESQ91943.1 hypothetical protein ABAC460_03330 [Asticcacaulis sp. AC460]
MRPFIALALICLLAVIGVNPVSAALVKNRGVDGAVAIQLNGKTLRIANVSGGDQIRATGKATSYTPLEFDMNASEFLLAAPEFSDMIAGRAFYPDLVLLQSNTNFQIQSATRIVTHDIAIEFPQLDAGGKQDATFHITLTPLSLEDSTASGTLPNRVAKRMPQGSFRLIATGLKQPQIQAITSRPKVSVAYAPDREPGRRFTITAAPMTFEHYAGSLTAPGDILDWGKKQMATAGYVPNNPETFVPLDITLLAANQTDTPSLTLHFAAAWPVRINTALAAGGAHAVRPGLTLSADTPSLSYVLPKPGDTTNDEPPPADDKPRPPVDPDAIQPASTAAVMDETYYVDAERNLALTLTGVRYSAERYAVTEAESSSSEIVPGQGQKLLIATFDVTNVSDHEIRLPYHYFTATARDAKGGIRQSEASYRAEDRNESEVGILPGETIAFETVNLMSAAYPVQELRIANASGENVYNLKTAPVTLLPGHLSADGIAFPDKVPAVAGEWYPAGVVDINLADVRVSRDPVDGEAPGDNYEYLVTTWQVRNGALGQRAWPAQASVYVYDVNGQSWYSGQALTEELTSVQPGFAGAGQDGDKQTVVLAVYVPKGTKVARIEFTQGGNHSFVFKP